MFWPQCFFLGYQYFGLWEDLLLRTRSFLGTIGHRSPASELGTSIHLLTLVLLPSWNQLMRTAVFSGNSEPNAEYEPFLLSGYQCFDIQS